MLQALLRRGPALGPEGTPSRSLVASSLGFYGEVPRWDLKACSSWGQHQIGRGFYGEVPRWDLKDYGPEGFLRVSQKLLRRGPALGPEGARWRLWSDIWLLRRGPALGPEGWKSCTSRLPQWQLLRRGPALGPEGVRNLRRAAGKEMLLRRGPALGPEGPRPERRPGPGLEGFYGEVPRWDLKEVRSMIRRATLLDASTERSRVGT